MKTTSITRRIRRHSVQLLTLLTITLASVLGGATHADAAIVGHTASTYKWSIGGGNNSFSNGQLTLTAGNYRALYQGDGNLVVYQGSSTVKWASNTNGRGTSLILQGDGNVVIRNSAGTAIFATNTNGKVANGGVLGFQLSAGGPLLVDLDGDDDYIYWRSN